MDDSDSDMYVDDSNVGELKVNSNDHTAQPAMVPKTSAHDVYETLMANPDAPCTNRSLATVIELITELKSLRQPVVTSAMLDHEATSSEPLREIKSPRETKTRRTQFSVNRRDKATLQLQRDVHEFLTELLHHLPPSVPDPQVVANFNKGIPGIKGPEIGNLMLDLAGRGLVTRWNKAASALFSEAFVAEDVYECTNQKSICAAFDTYLDTLQKKYRKAQKESNLSPAEALEIKDRMKRRARDGRTIGLRHRRCSKALLPYCEIPEVNTLHKKLSHIPPSAFSDDELEVVDGEIHYVIIKPEWRDEHVDNLNEVLDGLDTSRRFQEDGTPKAGAFPHPRIPSTTRVYSGPPPPGLPSNWYKPSLLQGMTETAKKLLDMQPPLDCSFPPEILQIAARFRGVKSRDDKPLGREVPEVLAYTIPGVSL
ncbi:hypothetical protein NLJ89_g6789 [Agrocybe chaxingu]|uniref:Uncharacterized protein n=1 Tax=Agrocybe chaxingu TaxID=84603 RepID=A0A9W8K4V4_9AGAR|nr:hypothetical protein NLJ89_g6789 [Agrocybe chaxingu]